MVIAKLAASTQHIDKFTFAQFGANQSIAFIGDTFAIGAVTGTAVQRDIASLAHLDPLRIKCGSASRGGGGGCNRRNRWRLGGLQKAIGWKWAGGRPDSG